MDITCMYLRVSISYILQRSGRVEEEIEMLQLKLKHIDEVIAFSGRRAKTARSQGKKVQIIVKQEISRIPGNLAWAYLQQKLKYITGALKQTNSLALFLLSSGI
ncbi:protein SULFUR DEFICIENCY-INDUCED 1-like [Quercus robur]|uniref:protein SULFUR DEFICIENCY-INDUCED 1-like n=1 Tax=Quercus robur TaxID=38942 RepID=UPI002162C722|nr:protein SULFUR DEFICIENCY-INDUCED 1-like [Quercus robur]XP_050290682.1 protein SULFUR DEFICIENCY-INDUCED 1-like [Quercus robur]